MGNELKKTFAGLVALAALSLALGLLLFKTIFPGHYFSLFPVLVAVILLLNGLFFYIFFRSVQKPDAQFIRYFIASTGIKTILYIVIIFVYLMVDPQHAIPFSVTLLFLYFLFTAYDLFIMLRVLKRKKEKKPGADQQTY